MSATSIEKMKDSINQELIRTGERERLKQLLRERLLESGWRDQLKKDCKQMIRERGLDRMTVDELVKEITPRARQLVQDGIKKELLHQIRQFFIDNPELA